MLCTNASLNVRVQVSHKVCVSHSRLDLKRMEQAPHLHTEAQIRINNRLATDTRGKWGEFITLLFVRSINTWCRNQRRCSARLSVPRAFVLFPVSIWIWWVMAVAVATGTSLPCRNLTPADLTFEARSRVYRSYWPTPVLQWTVQTTHTLTPTQPHMQLTSQPFASF